MSSRSLANPTRARAACLALLLAGCAMSPPLHESARRGDAKALDDLLYSGASPLEVDSNGRTALHFAAESGHVASMDKLIEHGARIDVRSKRGETPLFLAVERGRIGATRRLLELHADPDSADEDRRTPLMEASERGDSELVRLLLEAGARVNARDEDRKSALSLATDQRKREVVRLLLAAGAAADQSDSDGRTPLYLAVEDRDAEIVEALLESGADADSATRDRQTPLIKALEQRDAEVVGLLLLHHADPNVTSQSGEPAIVIATRQKDAACLELLLEAGASSEARSGDGRTPLLMAAQDRAPALAEILLDARARSDVVDLAGQTPLIIAVQGRDVAMAKLLLEHGTDPEAASTYGARPLVVAMNGQDRAMTDLLLAAGAKPSAATEAFDDPAGYMARYGYKGMIDAALAHASESAGGGAQAPGPSRPARPAPPAPPAPPPLPDRDEAGGLPQRQVDARDAAEREGVVPAQSAAPRLEASAYYSRRIAVVVGIDDYERWPSLEGARRDAVEVSKTLRTMGFDEVIEVFDRDATRRRILTVLGSDLASKTDADSMAVIYFAGHGQTEALPGGTQRGYIVPADADPDQVFATAISMDTLRSISSRLPAKQVYYAMDSCYSGLGFTRGISVPRTRNQDYIEKITSLRVVQMITAGADGEQAIESGGQGIFTRYFLRAITGEADYDGDGWVTASEIGTFVKPHVSNASGSRQTPRFGTLEGSGEIAFAVGQH